MFSLCNGAKEKSCCCRDARKIARRSPSLCSSLQFGLRAGGARQASSTRGGAAGRIIDSRAECGRPSGRGTRDGLIFD